ncbi:MAG TPA: lysophospholipid acyltransferase family protein [Planctomycetota bacterium]
MKRGELWKYSRHWLNIRPVYGFGEWMLENLPLFISYGMVYGVTEIAYHSSPNQRRSIEGNVRHVLSKLKPALQGPALDREVVSTAHDIFQNRGRWFIDLSLMAGKRQIDGLFRFNMSGAWDQLKRTLASGRGAILASAHIGNWFGGGYVVSKKGIPVRSVMYKNMAGDEMDKKVAKRAGVDQTYVEDDPMVMMEIIRGVRSGQVLAVLVDKPWDSRGVEVPFFGRPSRFAVGPIRLARMAGVPIFPAFCTWTKAREYDAVLCDPIEVGGGDPETAEREALAKVAKVVERVVSENLKVWFNFTPAWSDGA